MILTSTTYTPRTHAEIVVAFRWPDLSQIRGNVVHYARHDPGKDPAAVQDIEIHVYAPAGSGVRESAVGVLIYHASYEDRVVVFEGFRMVDTSRPTMSAVWNDQGIKGETDVLVRRSGVCVCVCVCVCDDDDDDESESLCVLEKAQVWVSRVYTHTHTHTYIYIYIYIYIGSINMIARSRHTETG